MKVVRWFGLHHWGGLLPTSKIMISRSGGLAALFSLVLVATLFIRIIGGPRPGSCRGDSSLPNRSSGGALPLRGAAVVEAAEFFVENRGGTPVRILSVQSSCGSAKPNVRPSTWYVAPEQRSPCSRSRSPR